jgi:hypothetical protein
MLVACAVETPIFPSPQGTGSGFLNLKLFNRAGFGVWTDLYFYLNEKGVEIVADKVFRMGTRLRSIDHQKEFPLNHCGKSNDAEDEQGLCTNPGFRDAEVLDAQYQEDGRTGQKVFHAEKGEWTMVQIIGHYRIELCRPSADQIESQVGICYAEQDNEHNGGKGF